MTKTATSPGLISPLFALLLGFVQSFFDYVTLRAIKRDEIECDFLATPLRSDTKKRNFSTGTIERIFKKAEDRGIARRTLNYEEED